MDIYILDGDITQVTADGLLTAVNSGRAWFGGIDGVLKRTAGDQYHRQLGHALDRIPGIRAAVTTTFDPHDGEFDRVVFVIDDLDRPLADVITDGLQAADQHGCRTLTMPAIRLGVMRDVAGTVDDKVAETVRALKAYGQVGRLESVSVVIYRDPHLLEMFRTAL